MTEITILEGFAEEKDGGLFQCDECSSARRFYDLLSDERKVCLECSTKSGYSMDPLGTYHNRSQDLVINDPELRAIAGNIVQWKIDTGNFSEISLKMPEEVLDQLYKLAEQNDSSVEILINAGASLILNNLKPDKE